MNVIIKSLYDQYGKLLRYGIVGVLDVGLGIGLLISLSEMCGWPHFFANTVSSVVAFEASFLLHYRFTWLAPGKFFRRLWLFHLIKGWLMVLNWGLFWLLTASGIEYVIANLIIVGLLTGVSFVLNDRFTFKT